MGLKVYDFFIDECMGKALRKDLEHKAIQVQAEGKIPCRVRCGPSCIKICILRQISETPAVGSTLAQQAYQYI
jgi:hypothetical protein